MSFPSRNGSIQIRKARIISNQYTNNNNRIVYVDPSKSPAELVFFRESFKVLDAHHGTNWKRTYTKLINGYQCGNINWKDIPGLLSPHPRQGYIAAIQKVCFLLEITFKLMAPNQIQIEDAPTTIAKLARYARKVYVFRKGNAINRGHHVASDTWEEAAEQLEALHEFLKDKLPAVIVEEIKPEVVIPIPVVEKSISPSTGQGQHNLETKTKDVNISVPMSETITPDKTKSFCTKKVVLIIVIVLILIGIVGSVLYLHMK